MVGFVASFMCAVGAFGCRECGPVIVRVKSIFVFCRYPVFCGRETAAFMYFSGVTGTDRLEGEASECKVCCAMLFWAGKASSSLLFY